MQRQFRLTRGDDFARLRQQGRVYHHRLMSLTTAPNDQPTNRYGFVTSKRLGNAVVRNRTRRLLREAVRQLHPQLQPGYDVVIVARREIVGQHFLTISRIVEQLAQQAGLLRAESDPK